MRQKKCQIALFKVLVLGRCAGVLLILQQIESGTSSVKLAMWPACCMLYWPAPVTLSARQYSPCWRWCG